jgi:hypothetical protein
MDDLLIAGSIKVARENWEDWRVVFEHGDSVSDNPLLVDPRRFAVFLKKYSVSRTIRRGTHDEFRQALIQSKQFVGAVQDNTGHALDLLEGDLRRSFGTHDGKNRITSALSKVAAFVRPELFVAWDNYAKKGVNVAVGRTVSARFDTYADYLAAFNMAWDGQPGRKIRDYVAQNGAKSAVESQSRFQRRVLDVCLMKLGKRPDF